MSLPLKFLLFYYALLLNINYNDIASIPEFYYLMHETMTISYSLIYSIL